MDTKKCTKCKEIKPIDNFVKDKYRPDGLAGSCKLCRKENIEKIKKSKKIIPEKKVCIDCKETKKKALFDKKSASYDGLSSRCKKCRSIKNKDKLKDKKYIKINNKKCAECGIDKNISCFHKSSYRKDNHSNICKSCTSVKTKNYYEREKENVKERVKIYRKNNSEAIKERAIKYREINGDKLREKERKHRAKNRQKYRDLNKKWRDNNKEKLREIKKEYARNNRDLINKWVSDYKKENPLFKLGIQTRANLWNNFNKLSKGLKIKSRSSEEILGCTMEEFKNHIESQFLDWMNWDNYGNCENSEYNCSWHLDHIIPISFAKNEEEFYILNHWSNFQPKCGKKNLEKNGKFILCSNIELGFTSDKFNN